jgi:Flp pilus assembly protein TadG
MFRDKERGAALIEFVLVLPLLLLLIFGIIEFSVMFYDKAVITNASREVARDFAIYRQTAVNKAYYNAIVTEYAQKRLISFT